MTRRALAADNAVEIFSDDAVMLERLANSPLPNVLVLDWQLPGWTGLEVCRFVRKRHDEMALPILMLTMFGRKQDIVDALDAGANDYVTKPFDVSELSARVATLVRTSTLQRAERRRSQRLALTAEIGAVLSVANSAADLATPVLVAIRRYAEAESCALYSVQDRATTDIGSLGLRRGSTEDLVARALATGAEAAGPTRGDDGSPAATMFPCVVQGELLGLLEVITAHPLDPEVHEAIMQIAELLAVGFGRIRAEDEKALYLEREKSARAEAEAANRSKDEFLAMVSHELRTPLNSIIGWSTLLVGGELDPPRATRALETIHRNAQTQAQLIDDLLDISRIISGKLLLRAERVDMQALLEVVAESVRLAAQTKQIRLEVDFGTPVVTKGDSARLQQVLSNLLSNAIKFSRPGGVVNVTLRTVDEEIEIAVRDEGQGIDAAFLPYVFDRFRQADASSSRTKGGLGLGLAIVKHLVARHGGSVDAASEGVGRGATFTVRVPRDASPVEAVLPTRTASPGVRSDVLAGLDVVVVEDDDDSRDLIRWLLEKCGASVRAVGSAKDAYDEVVARIPDVVVSDIAMPGEDGFAMLKRIRALPDGLRASVPAVALTANARAEDRIDALGAGFQDHLAKPVEPAELVAVLRGLVSPRPLDGAT